MHRAVRVAAALVFLAPAAVQAQALMKSAIQVDAGNTKQAGQTFGYRLTYNCSSTSGPCIGAQVVDLLPSEVQFVSTVPASPTGDVASIAVTPNFGGSGRTRVQFVMITPLPAGNSGDLIINVRFPNGSTPDGTVAVNTADGINLETTPGTSTTPPVSVTAVASVQVSLQKTLQTSPANLDMPETYRLRISVTSNSNGSLNLTSVGPVTDTLPPGTVFDGSTPAADCQPGCVGTTPATLTWTAPCTVPLTPGSNCDISVGVSFPSASFPSGTNVTNSFTADGTPLGQPPQNLGTGQVTHQVTAFVPNPSASFAKNVTGGSPNPPTLNQTFSYELVPSNNGNVPLDSLTILDTLPVEMQVASVRTGAYNNLSDFGPGVGVSVSYEKNTAPGVFTLWGSSPNVATNTTLTAPPPGLGAGEYITRLRWEYGQAQIGMASSSTANRPQITGQIVDPDNAGGPVAFGDSIQNCADLTAVYTAGPTNVSRSVCRTFTLSGPFVQLNPAKDNLSGGGPFNPGQNVSWRLRVRTDSRSSDPVPLDQLELTDLLPVDLVPVGTFTFDDQATGLPAPQNFEQVPNFANTGRTLLRWRWNAGSGSLGPNQQVWLLITTSVRSGATSGNLSNTFTLGHDDPGLSQRCSGSSQADALDLDEDGNSSETLCSASTTIAVAPIAQLVSGKEIRATCDADFTSVSSGTLEGGRIEYRLRVQNLGTVPMQNFVLIDILPFVGDTGVRDTSPRGSQWTPLLSAPIVPPAGTVLYYSTAGDPCRGEVGGPTTGCTPPNWTTVAPDPITSARSFKIEFGGRVVGPQDFIEFQFQMLTPGDVPAGQTAFNSFAYQASRSDGLGSLAAEPQKVGVAPGTCVAAALGDFVWVDLNGNGLQDDGPTGLNGVFVQLFTPGGDVVPGTPDDVPLGSTLTSNGPGGAAGWYSFPGLAPGDYYVRFTAPPTFVFTTADQGSDAQDSDASPVTGASPQVNLAPGEMDPTIDAGLVATHTAALGNYVWFDIDGNGLQDESSWEGVNGVSLRLFLDDGDGSQEPSGGDVLIASTVTTDDLYGQTGYYLFDGLVPGLPYFVQFILPAAATGFTVPDAGGDDAIDSDARVSDGSAQIVSLAPDEVNRTIDTGLTRPVGTLALGDQVWLDADNDGVYEPQDGEPGLNSVRLFLYADSNGDGQPTFDEYRGASLSATLGGFAGRYRFSSLAAGNYIVVIDPQSFSGGGALAGLVSSTGNDPAPDPDNDLNGDDNGTDLGALTAGLPVTLTANGEPTNEDGDANTNLTVDFGFILQASGPAPQYDYGDAPDVEAGTSTGEYSTTALDTGAFHLLGVRDAPFLGACVDADGGFNQDSAASQDDTNTSATVTGTCLNADDEDGVSFSGPFVPGSTAAFVVTAGGPTACTLQAWVDWNRDGVFGNSAGEAIAMDLNVPPGPPAALNPTVPANAVPGLTYARFRCATAAGLPPTGGAGDGEVEDYLLGIVGTDFGDAPASYGTQGAGAASHAVDPTAAPFLLGGCVDTEPDGQPGPPASGDDASAGTSRIGSCFDDEDGVVFQTPVAACQPAQITVVASAAGLLDAWMDFNRDNDFTDAADRVFSGQALAAGSNPLVFTPPCNVSGGASYARFRFSSAGIVSPLGSAADGEVEDYPFTIDVVDFGDAPDTYGTTGAAGGPNHRIVSGFSLGASVDAEADGQPSLGADTDGADEDGVTLPGVGTLRACVSDTLIVSLTNGAGIGTPRLDAWIDFDRDGNFDDPRDRIASSMALFDGANNLDVSVPCDSAPGGTYARFRLSSAGVPTSGGAANEGEVEDYAVQVLGVDFGDAPDSYGTLLVSSAARHTIVAGFSLGPHEDHESDGQPNSTADGDDSSGSPDDEDGAVFSATLSACTQSNSLSITLTNSASVATPQLDAWIDFNGDGDFDHPAEHLFGGSSAPLASGSNSLSFDVPCDAAPQAASYARFRLSSSGSLTPTSTAIVSDGEVEDYAVQVLGVDFGDAPDSYGTLLASSAARHTIVAGFSLGPHEDHESDGQPNSTADGDDSSGSPDDEDGIQFPLGSAAAFTCLTQNALTAILTNTASISTPQLDAWIDFNGDGDFDHPAEHLFGGSSAPLASGSNSLSFDVPCDAAPQAASYARFRLSSSGSLTPTSTANALDGEVEDYAFAIEPGVDRGDLPDSYGTLTATAGASHTILAGFLLGAAIDADSDGQPSATAAGDDASGSPDDEDGVVFGTGSALICAQDVTVTVTLVNSAAVPTPQLDAWIDFNGDADLDHPAEHLFGGSSVSLQTGANLLSFDVPCSAVPQARSYARFRLSGAGALAPTGGAADGEVEDYVYSIQGTDLGDAPDSYGTTLAQSGAMHPIVPGFGLGSATDSEPDGQPSAGADGDDTTGTPDDEDGIVFGLGVAAAPACSEDNLLTVTLDNSAQMPSAFLDAWLDFDADGLFDHPSEHLFGGASQALAPGPNVLSYDLPCTALIGASTTRIRLSSTGGLLPTGVAPDGEVEDDPFQIEPIQVLCSRSDACFTWSLVKADFQSSPGSAVLSWLLQNTCSSPLQRMDLRFVPGATVLAPAENEVVTSQFGHLYQVEVVGGPHPGVGWIAMDAAPLQAGEIDLFTLTVDTISLDPDVVLWNSASTADGQTARMDMRSSLCFQAPRAEVSNAAACARVAGNGGWRVEVQWDRTRSARAAGYHLFRLATPEATPEPLTLRPLAPDTAGHCRWGERLEALEAAAYLIQPVDAVGSEVGGPVRVDIELCPPQVPSGRPSGEALLGTLLLLAGVAGLRRRPLGTPARARKT